MKRSGKAFAVALATVGFCCWTKGYPSSGAQETVSQADRACKVPSGQKFIMRLETPLHTRTTHKGDKVEFTTAAEVSVGDQIVLPNASRVHGTVTKAKRAGRLKGRAEIQIRLDEIQLADSSVVPLHATISRVGFDPVSPEKGKDATVKGDSGSGGDAGTIGKAAAEGAIIGILSGGPRGAIYGSAAAVIITGAGMILKRGPDLDLPRDTMFEAQFDQALEIPAAALPRPKPVQIASEEPAPPVAGAPPDIPTPERPRLTRHAPVEPPPAGNPADTKTPDTPPSVTPAGPPARQEEPQPAPARGFSLSVSVQMVLVDAVVKDRGGHMIENLTRDDFVLFEDGVKQELQTVSHDELPLAIALVIDRSGSESPYISELRRIAEQTLTELKPQDEVALFSFAANVTRIQDLTADRRKIADGIASIRAGGGTDIVDALYESAKYLAAAAPDRRHAIILISDNQNTVNPSASESATIKVAMESETVVYSIKTQGANPPLALQLPSLISGSGPVGKITQETGGEIINAVGTASFSAALSNVIARLRLRYCLGYYPPSTSKGAFHTLVVRLTDSHGKPGSDYYIHARRGYYATSAPK